jgi:sterol desaturase/sphingolipid hydroxylase (fatty acid hydroxylase superfamily)
MARFRQSSRLVCWFVGTFFFYWHRAALVLFWRVFHQIHHSACRIETLTSFYKHPLEIAVNSVLRSIVFVLGASVEAAPVQLLRSAWRVLLP